jgi:hypothetical protein
MVSGTYKYNRVWVRRVMPGDINALLANMRKKDIEECKAFGMSPGRALRRAVKSALYAKSAWLDGKIVAMWGVSGPVISEVGGAWMLTGNGVETIPLTFVHIAMQELEEMHKYKKALTGHVAADYHEAVRLLSILGFSIARPRQVGHNGVLLHQVVRSGD